MKTVIFSTPGTLDLRGITTFGMNAKPNSTNPIGYFGTGLKYAVAVLAREEIPMVLLINGTRWTIEVSNTTFRDKQFKEIFLKRHTKLGFGKSIKLPFTTEFGKNWGLWQVFRELHSNTLDENGGTFVVTDETPAIVPEKHRTIIYVQSDKFAEEYANRSKTFLIPKAEPVAKDETLEIYPYPSKHIYYRGIRVVDLKEKEYSQFTYNILSHIDLTEDRTAKSEYAIKWLLSEWIAKNAPEGLIAVIINSREKTLEKTFDYTYAAPSKTFLNTVEKHKYAPGVSHSAVSVTSKYRPKPERKFKSWQEALCYALENDDWEATFDLVRKHKDDLLPLVQEAERLRAKEEHNNQINFSTKGGEIGEFKHTTKETVDDDIPF